MDYITIAIFVLLGMFVLVIRHLVWRGFINIAGKPFYDITFGTKNKNRESKKATYGDIKYKNQQLIISIIGFPVLAFVLFVVFIWLPDMWIGYQIMLCIAVILVPGAIGGILISRRRD